MAADTRTENRKDRILETLSDLRRYALQKAGSQGISIGLHYHEEDSHLMRFANSAISLNTNEHLIRLDVVAYQDRRRASYELITDLGKRKEMQQGIDTAIELVQHSQPLTYQPSIPAYAQPFDDESAFDPSLADISNADRLAFFNQAVSGLETDQVRSSGIFSNGSTTQATIYTTSEHIQYFRLSDAQAIAVLAHEALKWEVLAEGSAQRSADLDPGRLNRELSTLIAQLGGEPPHQLPLGRYDIVFGPPAIADLLEVMSWIGFDGGTMKRGSSFLSEAQVGQQVFSPQVNLNDDATRRETFPIRRDLYGLPRGCFPVIEQGVFQGFTWSQDDADEFNATPTGHTVDHASLVLAAGAQDGAGTLEALAALPRERDLLYIPYMHYMNIVNRSKGLVTASSRFGARLLRADGSIGIPFNVRLTQSLLDIFGEKVAWLSHQTVACNTSHSYGRRNPSAVIVPAFMRVNDLEISHSNAAY